MSLRMWIAPRDMCALLATRQARSMVSRELAKKMVVDADSPEVLFAMASFHKFYQQFYRKCLSACDQATLDTHRLVRVPILVFRMLQSLGFCTITDEDGNDILVTDGDGRPVCGWWGSGGGSGLMSDLRAANATYHPPSSLYPITRIGQTINRLVLKGHLIIKKLPDNNQTRSRDLLLGRSDDTSSLGFRFAAVPRIELLDASFIRHSSIFGLNAIGRSPLCNNEK